MKKVFICISLLVTSISYTGCVESNSNGISSINYDKLNRVEVELVNKKDDKAQYLPSHLGNLVVTTDGSMFASDLGKTTIEQFNKEGEHVKTIAQSGRGPGELSTAYFSLLKGGKDTLVVKQDDGRIGYYSSGPQKIYKHVGSILPDKTTDHRLDLLGYTTQNGFYARTGPKDVELISTEVPEYRNSKVSVISTSLTLLRDSLHILKTPNNLFVDPRKVQSGPRMNGLTLLGIPPYRFQDRFRIMKNGNYMIARANKSTLDIYNPNRELEKKIPLDVKPRPVRQVDLNYLLRNKEDKIREELKNYVSEVKPPFLNVWVSDNYIWLHVDTTPKGKEVVVLTMEGKPIGIFNLSVFDDIQFTKGNKIYTLYKNPETGHKVKIYKANL